MVAWTYKRPASKHLLQSVLCNSTEQRLVYLPKLQSQREIIMYPLTPLWSCMVHQEVGTHFGPYKYMYLLSSSEDLDCLLREGGETMNAAETLGINEETWNPRGQLWSFTLTRTDIFLGFYPPSLSLVGVSVLSSWTSKSSISSAFLFWVLNLPASLFPSLSLPWVAF